MNVLTPHQSKALNIESSISLTANAGSGKTFVLSQRYISILLYTDTPINQVAAITFTEKAAGELYKRVSNELHRLFQSTDDAILKQRIEKIRKRLVSAKISTIHSFCIDLLKEFPVEASVDANFIPIDEQRNQELISLSIEDTFREIFKDSKLQSDIKLLVRLFGSKANLFKQLAELISKRRAILKLIHNIYYLSETEIAEQFSKLFKSGFKSIFGNTIFSICNEIKIINEKVLSNEPDNETAIQIKNLLAVLPTASEEYELLKILMNLRDKILIKEGSVRKKSYLDSRHRDNIQNSILLVEQFFSELDELEFNSNHIEIEKELAKYGLAFVNVFRNVLSALENKKSESGVLDFEDILIKTRDLLTHNSVKESLSGKYKFLLVDEYQDTNEIQYEIFLPLLEDLKKGNLFIVGDEKQSIYRFRDAELRVFSKTKYDIEKLYGDASLLTLPDSFRMAPAICFFINVLFENLFRNPREIFNEVALSQLVCARSDNFKGSVEFLIGDGEKQNEAELLAKKIIQLKLKNKELVPDWSNIAVLVRKRSSFSELQKIFIEYNIPFIIVGGTGFYQQQSISDIYNYFAFLLNDKDDGALIGILRSPFFNISDTRIFELSSFEGQTYWGKLQTAANSEKEIWEKQFNTIEENKKLSERVNIPFLLRKILQESYFISTISSRINGVQELSNVNKLISLTIDFFDEEFNTLYDYVSFLKEAISKTEDEAQAGIGTEKNGVNVLTIHQAKGLEYSAVFLFKCNDYTRTNNVKAGYFSVDENSGLLTKVPLNENYFGKYESAPIVGLYNLIESKKDIAELKRLLYVGLTRAENFLFVTLTYDGKTPRENSFVRLITDGLGLDLRQNFYKLFGDLNYLKNENGVYLNTTENIHLEIPLIREIEDVEVIQEKDVSETIGKEINISKIKDHSKGEVISATRFSTFSDCPAKYNLFYNYKVGELFYQSLGSVSFLKKEIYEEYNRNELGSHLLDDQSKQNEYSKIKGKLIHYILSKNIEKQKLDQFIKNQVKNLFKNENTGSLENEIKEDLNLLYNSDGFRYISSFPNYKNEFEVYLKVEDYYLFGILDKLIITDEKLIIVDYKTDDISEENIKNRAEKYLSQVKFYSYIVSRLFNNKKEIEGRIIFIKQPDNPFIIKYDKLLDKELKSGLTKMISSIRNNNYSLNLDSCKECIFGSDNSLCSSLSA